MGKIDAGRKATPEEALQANTEAMDLALKIDPLNLKYAAEYIRQNRPSPEAIAMLGFITQALKDAAQQLAKEERLRKGRSKGGFQAAESRRNKSTRRALAFEMIDKGLETPVIKVRTGFCTSHINNLRLVPTSER